MRCSRLSEHAKVGFFYGVFYDRNNTRIFKIRMRYDLRYYQSECVESTINAWNERKDIIPYSSMMTGLGKSLVISDITDKAIAKGKRVIQLVPRLELVRQNYNETINHVGDDCDIGICCSKLNKHEFNKQAVVAMYQSFLNRRATSGSFDVCLIDECDNVGNDPDSSYRKIIRSLLRINPKMLIAGFTATPYRLGQGMLHIPCFKGENLFTDLVYDTSVYPGIRRLIDEGYLAHVDTINTSVSADLSGVKISGIDFNQEQAGVKFDAIIDDAVEEIREGFKEHDVKTAIIYVSTKKNAEHVLNTWGDPSTMRVLHDGLGTKERDALEKWLKKGNGNRYIVNIDIYTRGFNFPELEGIVMLRATVSPNLLVQIAGRLLRPHKGKIGKFWDFGSNCERLGGIENIIPPSPKKRRGEAPKKLCTLILDESVEFEGVTYKRGQECNYANILAAKFCKKCGGEFISENEEGKYSMRSRAQILAAKIEASTVRYDVGGVVYAKAYSRKDSIPMIKMLIYGNDANLVHTHLICLDHPGHTASKARHFVMDFFKREEDYYELGQAGVNVNNMLHLLNNAEQYFKKIVVAIVKPVANSDFKELKVEFE